MTIVQEMTEILTIDDMPALDKGIHLLMRANEVLDRPMRPNFSLTDPECMLDMKLRKVANDVREFALELLDKGPR